MKVITGEGEDLQKLPSEEKRYKHNISGPRTGMLVSDCVRNNEQQRRERRESSTQARKIRVETTE